MMRQVWNSEDYFTSNIMYAAKRSLKKTLCLLLVFFFLQFCKAVSNALSQEIKDQWKSTFQIKLVKRDNDHIQPFPGEGSAEGFSFTHFSPSAILPVCRATADWPDMEQAGFHPKVTKQAWPVQYPEETIKFMSDMLAVLMLASNKAQRSRSEEQHS